MQSCLSKSKIFLLKSVRLKKKEKHMSLAATKRFLFFKLTALGKLIFFFASNVYLQLWNKLPKKVGMILLSLLRSLLRSFKRPKLVTEADQS